MNAEILLESSALKRLQEWGGAELRNQMIDLFFEHGPSRLEGVREGLDGGDLELAERSVHSLKSSAANLGAQAVQLASARIEELLEGGADGEARALLPELEEKFGKTVEALETLRRQEEE